jgi:hypothetical protein
MPATGGGKKDGKGKESKKDGKQSAKKRESEVFLEGTLEVNCAVQQALMSCLLPAIIGDERK